MIKLSKFAKDLKVTKMTLWNWKNKGLLEFIKIGSLNYVDLETYNKFMGIKEKSEESVVIYCRVSSTENKTNLESQRKRLEEFCCAKGYKVSKVICEFGSGLNDNRPKLNKLLEESNFTKLVVEHKDRLTRFGFNYIKTLLKTKNIEIEVVNLSDDNEENLIEDFVSVITSFCARIYGKRRSKRKTEELIESLKCN
jgi:putative resolvase